MFGQLSSESPSPGDDYFNNLSRQPPGDDRHRTSSYEGDQQLLTDDNQRNSQLQHDDGLNGQIPKPKRIACVLCRKRKLRCNGNKPSCGTCERLQHECSYDEVRRKSGPKRGYVKALEARLHQVEKLLQTQDDRPPQDVKGDLNSGLYQEHGPMDGQTDMMQQVEPVAPEGQEFFPPDLMANFPPPQDPMLSSINETFSWDMIGLGLDEPLPSQEVIDDLTNLYFEKLHPTSPMIHRPRFFAAMNLAPHLRPPVCLRYAMWCNAAVASDKYEPLHEHFYVRARKYVQQDEMKGHGESMVTLAHSQTWALLGTYEFKLMHFPRAWMSAGRASRMSLMMGLHRVDGKGLDVKQCLSPARDATEREERRRTFWYTFCIDRYASIGTGWPMVIDERDITSNLPCSEQAYELNKPTPTCSLADALAMGGPTDLSGFAGVAIMACLFGRNLTHLHRPSPDEREDDLHGEFWKRHRSLDDIISHIALSMPDHLRLPAGLNEPNIVFLNLSMHTSTICLHQAAIFKADQNKMPAPVSAESKIRCITAAAQIASIMRQASHVDVSTMNPFVSFCLYVAARVFVQYLKSRPNDLQRKSALQFLLSAMHAIKRKTPLTESFLAQLDVDLEIAGLESSRTMRGAVCFAPGTKPMSQESGIVYGDMGAAAYNDPELVSQPLNGTRLEGMNMAYAESTILDPNISFVPTNTQFSLPHRTPGSHPSSTVENMDFSPDGSGDAHTSTSSSHYNISSHTSTAGYSPGNMSQQQPQSKSQQTQSMNLQNSNQPSSIYLDLNLSSTYPSSGPNNTSQNTFPSISQTWSNSSSTLSPSHTLSPDHSAGHGTNPNQAQEHSTGYTPGASGVLNGLSGFTDAEWQQVLEMDDMRDWETGVLPVHAIPLSERLAAHHGQQQQFSSGAYS